MPDRRNQHKRWDARTVRLMIMLILCTILFFLEIIVGYAAQSIALIADAFHMLSDVMSLMVAMYAIKLAKRKTGKNGRYTYGWQRAEVLGALINAVFLIALCFIIFLEAVKRFFTPEDIKNPELVLYVGSAGLVVNLLGLVIFHEHAHVGHGHSHEHHPSSAITGDMQPIPLKHSDSRGKLVEPLTARPFSADEDLKMGSLTPGAPPAIVSHNIMQHARDIEARMDLEEGHTESKQHDHKNMNMHGVFLHILGDALGSIGVIATALVIKYSSWEHKMLVDPILSLFITALILWSSVPLTRNASMILLQGTPRSIPIEQIRSQILNIDGVVDLHELHIWQLSDHKTIASAHVVFSRSEDEYMQVGRKIKETLHSYGIHSTTVQPEFVNSDFSRPESAETNMDENACLLRCKLDCDQPACCD